MPFWKAVEGLVLLVFGVRRSRSTADEDKTGTPALERPVALLVRYKHNYLVMCLLEYTGLLSVYVPLNFKHI